MNLEALLVQLLIGAVAGFLASALMKGKGLGLTGNNIVDYIILGVIGAFVGGWVLGTLGLPIAGGMVGAIARAFIGACIFIFVVRLLKRA